MSEQEAPPVHSPLDSMALSYAKQFPHLMDTNPELKAFVEADNERVAKEAKEKVTGKSVVPKEEVIEEPVKEPVKTVSNQTKPETTEETEEVTEPEIPGTFFAEKKAKAVKIEKPEDVEQYAKKKYQIEKPEDWGTFFGNVEKWRSTAQKASEVEEKYESVVGQLANMPFEIQSSILAWSKGEDYKQVFQKSISTLDFNKPLGEHPKKEIINYYYPNEFSEDDFEDFDNNPQLKTAFNMVEKTFYPKDQKAIKDQRADLEREAERLKETLTATTNSSVSVLEQSFPGMDKREVKKIEQILLSGDDGKLLGLFKNRDGSIKKEAAKMLSMALYGEDQIKALLKMTEEHIKGTYNTVRNLPKKPTETTKTVQQTNQEAANAVGGFVRKKTY
jgi:hypothetical protein